MQHSKHKAVIMPQHVRTWFGQHAITLISVIFTAGVLYNRMSTLEASVNKNIISNDSEHRQIMSKLDSTYEGLLKVKLEMRFVQLGSNYFRMPND
jgi:hypothetical protein